METCAAMPTMAVQTVPADIVKPIEQTQPVPVTGPITTGIFSCIMTGTQFKEMMGSLNSVCTDTRLHIDHDGITSIMVDNANVAMVDLNYFRSSFETFKVIKPVTLGIDVPAVYGLRTMIKKDSLVQFQIEEKITPADKDKEERSQLFLSVSIEGCITRFTGLDTNTIRKDPKKPTINLQTRIALSAGDFIQGIKDIGKITDKVAMKYENGVFSMIGEGDTTTMNKIISTGARSSDIPLARSLYSLDYLKDIIKVLDKKDDIVFKFGNDVPFELFKGNEYREITYLLAPRIETD